LRVVIVDIPPALALSQWYLTRAFPERPTHRFRPTDDHAGLRAALETAELAFLTPDQLAALPSLGLEVFVNISSLHEMRPDQIERYLQLAEDHCTGVMYSKQWERSDNVHDQIVVERHDYPIPAGWTTLLERSHPLQAGFFEALYRLPGAP
jgi:hypothetical protein